MSLIIYRRREDVPCEIQDFSDSYFDLFTPLWDDELTREILMDIDKAVYLSEDYFGGRTNPKLALSREYLSTGTKTLLNVLAHPDVCFNIIGCGDNVHEKLVRFKSGIVYWRRQPLIGVYGECDIVIDGYHFSDIGLLRRYLHEDRT